MKLGVLANSNTLNLMVKFSRPLLDQKHPFRTICFQKVKNFPKSEKYLFKMKVGAMANSITLFF